MSGEQRFDDDQGQPTPSTEALLEQGAQQLARSRRLISEIEALVRPSAQWPSPRADDRREAPPA
jgi:hypothetical protein